MGVDSPMVTDSAPDTPYNMPEPEQKPVVGPNRNKMSKSESAHEVSSVNEHEHRNVHMPKSVSIDSGLFRVHRVAPLKSAEDVEQVIPEEVPHNETPIEQEIRLTREREEELRKQHGLPVPTPAPQVMVNLSVNTRSSVQSRPKRSGETMGSVQKLASSMIQKEIASQHNKELMLQNEGTIRSLSTDELDHHNYVDIISKDQDVAPPPQGSHREPSTAPRDSSVYLASSRKMYTAPAIHNPTVATNETNNNAKPSITIESNEHPCVQHDTRSRTSIHSPVTSPEGHIQGQPQGHAERNAKANGTTDLTNGTLQHTSPLVVHTPHGVNHAPKRAVSLHDPPKGQHYSIRRAQNPTGSRIEQELNEMRERENELRLVNCWN